MAENSFRALLRKHIQATQAGKLGRFEYSVTGNPPYTDAIEFPSLVGNGWIPPASILPSGRRNDQRFIFEIRDNDGTIDGAPLGDLYAGPLPSVSDFVSEDSVNPPGTIAAKFAFQFFNKADPSPGNLDPGAAAQRHYGYIQNTPTLTVEGGSGPSPNVVEFKSFLFTTPGPILSTLNGVDVAELEVEVKISIHAAVPASEPGPTRNPLAIFQIENLTGNPSPSGEWGISEFYFNFADSDTFTLANMSLRELPSLYDFNRNFDAA